MTKCFLSVRPLLLVAIGVLLLLPMPATLVHASRAIPEPENRVFTMTIPRGVRRADDLQAVEIERGKTILLYPDFRVSRLAVGDPEIADFVVIGDREIEILAKTVGDTNLLVWGDGQLQAVIDIHVGTLRPQIARELSRLLNNSEIFVDVAGGSIVLRGKVSTLQEQENATLLADAFLTSAQGVIGDQGLSQKPKVINLIEVGGHHQVMIEVVIAELSRNFRRAMGVNLMGKAGSGTQAGTFQTMLKNLTANPELYNQPGTPAGLTSISDSVTMAGSFFSSDSMDLRIFLEAVEANQLGSILAEPNLVARSGEAATFLVGGEIPIPLITGFGSSGGSQYTVLFKKFGVNVEFTPTVLSQERIHLMISPEVSEPDYSVGARVLGQTIPAFRTRRVETSVELGDGESFVLAGLLREDMLGDVEDFPFLADIPILGQLFRSRAFQKTQTELVLIVTPHLVQALEAGTHIELPTDHYIEPTLLEFYWDGRIEGRSPTPPGKEEEGAKDSKEKFTEPVFSEPRDIDLDGIDDDESGGFMGSFGYRLQSPKPTGGIE